MRSYRYTPEIELWYEDYRRIVETVPMTPHERDYLFLWISSNHDFYDNPWGYEYGEGFMMDYLDALRAKENSIYEYRLRINEER